MAAFMGVDLGTSSIKVLIVDEEGKVLAQSARSYRYSSPVNGYAEQDPEEWWEAFCQASREAVGSLEIPAKEVKAVGFSGQMHGLTVLDRNKKAVRPVILHCDARSKKQADELNEKIGTQRILRETMNPYCVGVALTSLMWLKEKEPENYERIRYVMLPKDYLKFRMTGQISTDCSDAAGSLAFGIREGKWSEEILQLLELPREWFPEVYETADVIGKLGKKAEEETGLKEGTLITAGGADQVMQAIGSGMILPGQATSNIGTAGQISVQTGQPIVNPSLNTNTFTSYKKDKWYVMGAMSDAAGSLNWLNQFFGRPDYDRLNRQVEEVGPGSGGLLFYPYLSGNRCPHLNPDISGIFAGITWNTGRAQMSRAVMEGVVFTLKECMELVCSLGVSVEEVMASGGGARSRPWLQMQADIFGIPVKTTLSEEQAGLGAAIAAGTGAGIYRDVQEGCRQTVRYSRDIYEPDLENRKRYGEYYELYKEFYRSCEKTLEKLTLLGRREERS